MSRAAELECGLGAGGPARAPALPHRMTTPAATSRSLGLERLHEAFSERAVAVRHPDVVNAGWLKINHQPGDGR